MPRPLVLLCAALLLLIPAVPAAGDALMTTRAMKASTIAEVFLDETRLRAEVEVAFADVARLVADARGPRPDAETKPKEVSKAEIDAALATILRFETEAGPLATSLQRVRPGRRVPRDEVTGMPLPQLGEGDGEGEPVLFVELDAKLDARPASLTLLPPQDPTSGATALEIGFVLYHRDVAVNDFRYLSRAETATLDWDDPWFSRFDNRNLWRQFIAPLSVFVYVDAFEVRWEMVLRPKDLQQWVDLGLEGKQTLAVADQPAVKEKVAAFLLERNPMAIDGQRATPKLDRIEFIRRSLRQTGVIDPPEDLSLDAATLGVIYVQPIDGLPQTASIDWQLFHPKFPEVPAVATDEAGGLPTRLTQDNRELRWENFLKAPSQRGLVELPVQEGGRSLPLLSIGLLIVAVLLARRGRSSRGMLITAIVLLLAAAVSWPIGRVTIGGGSAPDEETLAPVMQTLLANVYHAFDFRDESRIYDTLAHSADGDVLEDVYLETQRALALQNQGGARVKIDEVVVEAATSEDASGDSLVCDCTWTASGSVGHWGHVHRRANRYRARFTLQPKDGTWKVTALELLDEERL